MGSLVRDFVKFDDEATTLERFAEWAMQAYRIAMPRGPALLVVEAALQESRIADRTRPRIPALALASPPQGDANAVREAARLLVHAASPLIQRQKMGRTPKGLDLSAELVELWPAPVDAMGHAWHSTQPSCAAGYQSSATPYAGNRGSDETNVRPSTSAWAISKRSNGSR